MLCCILHFSPTNGFSIKPLKSSFQLGSGKQPRMDGFGRVPTRVNCFKLWAGKISARLCTDQLQAVMRDKKAGGAFQFVCFIYVQGAWLFPD